jgi:small redox-active disulfide protein 2
MSLEIRVIGKGCYFCNELHKMAEGVVRELQVSDAVVKQVDEMDELLGYGVVNPPALVVNGKLKMMGRVLVRSRVRRAIKEELLSTGGAGAGEEG